MSHQHWKTHIKYSLSPNQEYLLDCYSDTIKPSTLLIDETIERQACIDKGFLTPEGVITAKGEQALAECELVKRKLKSKLSQTELGEDYIRKVDKFIDLFPNIVLPNGSSARASKTDVIDKLVKFFKKYKQYDWDTVLKATDLYTSRKEKENWAYMQTILNFISKTDSDKSVKSTLAGLCQMIIDNPDTYSE